ncbi:MAG: MmcB family DNA repair protein [Candidatus Bathyarchaeota archaeon]|nr:MmcB family DNA repair protein [Candidatus Bathyarchaeota archaeon]
MSGIRKHTNMIDWYLGNPEKIEDGFKPIFKEFGVGNWKRVDILGIDKDKRLCIVEIKTGKDDNYKKQVKKYRSALNKLFEALNLYVPIRIIIITPKGHVDLGPLHNFNPKLQIRIPENIPTSRELFGLKR